MVNEEVLRPGANGLWRTLHGKRGHAVFGPYVEWYAGVYRVDFRLALGDQAVAGDVPCARLDISVGGGRQVVSERVLLASDLDTDLRSFSVYAEFGMTASEVEYRIDVIGDVPLVIDPEPRVTQVAAVLNRHPPTDLVPNGADPETFARDTRRMLAALNPHDLVEHGKVRLGRDTDGGYVCIDDFAGIDTAFSFGINDEISWDRDAANRGLTIYQFDHTVSDPAPDDPRMHFEAKRIDTYSSDTSASLSDLIRRHDKGGERPNLILKMDIEGWEWDVFSSTPSEELARLAWITCELHYFQGLVEPEFRPRIERGLAALSEHFAVVHIHANVCGGASNVANTVVPNVVEATFANRGLYPVRPSTMLFPTPLDQSCDTAQPDFYLGSFRF